MVTNFEALDEFISSLQEAPPEDKKRGMDLERGKVKITITPRSNSQSSGLGEIIVYRDFGSGGRGAYVYTVPSLNLSAGCYEGVDLQGHFYDSQYNLPLNRFVSSLGGDEVEVDTTGISYEPKGSFYWDNRWKDISLTGADYTQEIYPRALRAILNNLGTFDANAMDIHFVDLFGGDGEFVKRLQPKLSQQLRAVTTFHIIDASAPSLNKARELFKEDANVVIHPASYLQTDQAVFQEVPMPPKLVSAIGGLCGNIIPREEALGITEHVYEEMAEGGLFVVTGRTGVLLNAEDFSRIGFKVKQMTIPENVVYLNSPYQLYVLEK